MITLDEIRIIAPLKSIDVIDTNVFTTSMQNGTISSMSFEQKRPFHLYVEVDYKNDEAVIEFSGKILLDDYPQLINKNNFDDCLNTINGMGFCYIDIAMVKEYGKACSLDVTKDISYTDYDNLTDNLRNSIQNYKKYLPRLVGGNLVIAKNVKSPKYQRRLTIYDKSRELKRAENAEFLQSLNDTKKLLSYFKDKIRFELNLNSMGAIRDVLTIKEPYINEIFGSQANPIRDFIDIIICEDVPISCNTLKDRKNLAFLRDCNMDIGKVEAEIRKYCSKGSHVSQLLKPYQTMLTGLSHSEDSLKNKLMYLLMEIIIVLPTILIS